MAVPFLIAVTVPSGFMIATVFLLDFRLGSTPDDTLAINFSLCPRYKVIFFLFKVTVGCLTLTLQLALLPLAVTVMVVSPGFKPSTFPWSSTVATLFRLLFQVTEDLLEVVADRVSFHPVL